MIFRALALWRLKRAGYRDVPFDMYWYSAFELARKDVRSARVLEKSPGDAWIIYNSQPHRIHTIDHENLGMMHPNAVMGYLHNLAETIIKAAQ